MKYIIYNRERGHIVATHYQTLNSTIVQANKYAEECPGAHLDIFELTPVGTASTNKSQFKFDANYDKPSSYSTD